MHSFIGSEIIKLFTLVGIVGPGYSLRGGQSGSRAKTPKNIAISCVCVCERERERERAKDYTQHTPKVLYTSYREQYRLASYTHLWAHR